MCSSDLLHTGGEPVDTVSVAEELRRAGALDSSGGRSSLIRIQAATPASANAAHYAQIVAELAMLRQLISTASMIQETAYAAEEDVDETIDMAEAVIFEVAERPVSDSLIQLYPALQTTMEQLEALYDRDSDLVGTATGFRDLDSILLGLHPSTLSIVAARPGQGKTSFCLGLAQHIALDAQRPVLVFSMEMGHLELTKRLLAAEANDRLSELEPLLVTLAQQRVQLIRLRDRMLGAEAEEVADDGTAVRAVEPAAACPPPELRRVGRFLERVARADERGHVDAVVRPGGRGRVHSHVQFSSLVRPRRGWSGFRRAALPSARPYPAARQVARGRGFSGAAVNSLQRRSPKRSASLRGGAGNGAWRPGFTHSELHGFHVEAGALR